MTLSVTEQAERVLNVAAAASLKIATAESCTGGLLSALLTEVEGVSHAFERGFVVYSEEAKTELLDVEPSVIERVSAVSAPCAEQMASGALAHSRADVAISITGYAGSPTDDDPGLVFFGVAIRGIETKSISARFAPDTRARIRLACIQRALDLLFDAIQIAAQSSRLASAA